jgi:hypothetical protein
MEEVERLYSNRRKTLKEVVYLKSLRISWLLLLIILFTFQQVTISGGDNMEISSTAFKDGDKIPIQYVMPGAGGKNVSVPLAWKNAEMGSGL